MVANRQVKLRDEFVEWVDKKGKRGEFFWNVIERLCKYPGMKK